jgi:hypothetical protein
MGDGEVGGGAGVMQERMTRDQVIERLVQANHQYIQTTTEYPDAGYAVPWSRERELLAFWREAGYKHIVEIGVERGQYSKQILKVIPSSEWHGVDPWKAYRGYREHVTQAKLDAFYAETVARLEPFGSHRVRPMRMDSVTAERYLDNGSIDVVYIDGNHTLPFVIQDLQAWVPKVRSGGMVCGHDYGRRRVGHVKEAVQAWTAAYDIKPWFLFTGDRSWSWGFVK